MPLPVFEIACVVIIALTLAAMARRRPARDLLGDYLALAIAAFVGEDTCVALYRYYAYAPGWHARLHHVPLLVPAIWPLVILSARDVAGALFPGTGRLRPLLVGAIVAFDASLVEVVAVRAGLWSWAEPGHLGVPIIGVLGWGYFALGADWALSLEVKRSRIVPRMLAVIAGPLAAHALIQLTWWGGFRWGLRRDLGAGSLIAVALIGAALLVPVLGARRAGRGISLDIALPRMIAAGLFFVLLVTTAPSSAPLWIHTLSVAVPYLAATRFSAPAAG
ncbi:MAG: hypothetical protein U0359_19580 [Byssovorax sp.]